MKLVVVDEGKALVFFFRQDFICGFLSTLRWKQLTRERTKTDL